MIFAKVIRPLLPVAAIFLTAATTAWAQPAPPKPAAVLRLPPLSELSDTINAAGYAMDMNQELQFLALFTLGQIGYPMFPGASRTENVGLVVFESSTPGQMSYVALGQFADDSAVPEKIQEMGWKGKKVGGWTALAPDFQSLNYVTEENIDEVLEMVRKRREFDFEIEVVRTREEMAAMREQLAEQSLRNYYDKNGPQADEQGADARLRNVDMAFAFLENISASSLGIDLNSEELVIGTRQEARPGTPEGEFFSAPSGGRVEVAQLLPDNGNAALVYKVDPKAATAYLDSFLQRMQIGSGEQGDKLIDEIQQTVDQINEEWDGTGAYSMTFKESDVDYVGVIGGDWQEEPFSKLLDRLFNDLAPQVIEKIPLGQYANLLEMANAGTHVPMQPSSELPLDLSNTIAGGSFNELKNYQPPLHHIVDGKIVVASQADMLKAQVDLIEKEEGSGVPVSRTISLKDGEALRAHIDIKELSLQSIKQMVDTGQSPSLGLTVKRLESTELKPMTIVVKTGDNTLTGRISLPVETIRALSAVMKEIDARQSEQLPQ